MVDRGVLDAARLHVAFLAYADVLASHAPLLNALNAFPLPDADTGSNMAATVAAAVGPLGGGAEHLADLASLCETFAEGVFLGARGNSGTILAQLFGGVCEVAGAVARIDGAVLAAALGRAAEVGPLAVATPAPGTILTVAADLADAAAAAAAAGGDLGAVLAAAHRAAISSVAATTAQNPVLAAAGVVDSGAVGYALWLDALWHAHEGRELPHPPVSVDLPGPAAAPLARPGAVGPAFEVMFQLEGDTDQAEVSTALARLGSSVVVAGRPGRLTCHVHTDIVDEVVALAMRLGTASGLRTERL